MNENFDCYWIFPQTKLNNQIEDKLKLKKIKYIVTNSVQELIDEIKNSTLMISNDSGPIHIASILSKPTFTIYGPTNPNFILPLGDSHSYIQKKISCSPQNNQHYCFTNAGRNGCPSFECMNQLKVNEVHNQIIQFISKLEVNQSKELAN